MKEQPNTATNKSFEKRTRDSLKAMVLTSNQHQLGEKGRSIVATTQLEMAMRFQSFSLWWTSNSPLVTKKEMSSITHHQKMNTFPAARKKWWISQCQSVVVTEQTCQSQETVKTITTKSIKVFTICHPMEISQACRTQFWKLKDSRLNLSKTSPKTK